MNKLLEGIKRPLKLCWDNKMRSSLWVIYIIFGGLLGVAINLINRWIFGDMSFQQALYVESVGGTFYTYSIVLISAAIGPLFFNLAEAKTLHFPDIKALTITTCFFVMVFCAVFYSNLEDKVSSGLNMSSQTEYSLDWFQLIFFILSIALALFCYGIEFLDKDPDHNKDIDISAQYYNHEQEDVISLEKSNPTTAGNEVRI